MRFHQNFPTILTTAGLLFALFLATVNAQSAYASVSLSGSKGVLAQIKPADASSSFAFGGWTANVPNDIDRTYVAVDTGGSATCAIRAKDRGIDCWGNNELGQATPPTQGKFKSLSLGEGVGCALTIGNRLVCWGQVESLPADNLAANRYLAVSAGDGHACAIRAGKQSVDCWGDNSHGQATPPAGRFSAISSRGSISCGIRNNGALACWGDSAFLAYPRPTGKFKDVSVGTLNGCAIRSENNEIVCWGNESYEENKPPVGSFRSITSGNNHSCGLRTNDTIACWGRNQWGQLNMPSDLKVKSVMAGGAQTCALDNARHLLCRGSFDEFGLGSPVKGAQVASSVSPPELGISKLPGYVSAVTDYIGDIFMNWASTQPEGSAETLLFIGGLLGFSAPAGPSQLDAIQSQLELMSRQLTVLDDRAKAILSDLKDLKCDDKLGAMDAAVVDLRAALLKYRGYGAKTDAGSIMQSVKNELTYAQQPGYIARDLRPEMRAFVDAWYDKVSLSMVNLNAALMNQNYKVGPLGACLDKAFVAYQKKSGDKQFDDRRIYNGMYWIIEKAFSDQAMAAQMLMDMNKFSAVTSLSDPAVQSATPVIPEGSEWNVATLCADVKAHAGKAASNLRWRYALDACNRNEEVTKLLYVNLAQQLEMAGAPYSDKDVMLSMGSSLLGYASDYSPNFLWLRSIGWDIPLSGKHWKWELTQEANNMKGHGVANVYFSEGDKDKLGTWRSDGNAWSALYEYADKANDSSISKERITYMADTNSEIDGNPYFANYIKERIFWMTSKTFDIDWSALWDSRNEDYDTYYPGAKCFAMYTSPADRWFGHSTDDVKNYSGMVCNTGALRRLTDHTKVERAGIGWDGLLVWSQYGDNRSLNAATVARQMGPFEVQYYTRSKPSKYVEWRPQHVNQYPGFLRESVDLSLARMPVLDVKYRNCTPSMVIANQNTPRVNFRMVSGLEGKDIELPSRCGTDMDYFIEKMLLRPSVPGLDQIVRKPIYPDGVN